MKKLMILAIAVLFMIPAWANAGMGLGLKGGVASSSDFDDNLTHVGADFRFGLVMVELIISGEYSWKKYDLGGYELTAHQIAGTGSLVYPIKLPVVSPYVGGGVGSHTFIFSYGESAGTEDLTETKFGYHFIGGVKLGAPTMPIKLYAEYRHYWVPFEGETAKYYTLTAGIILGM